MAGRVAILWSLGMYHCQVQRRVAFGDSENASALDSLSMPKVPHFSILGTYVDLSATSTLLKNLRTKGCSSVAWLYLKGDLQVSCLTR